jgi:negative regulator of flagellin synthesis FlgM
MISKIKDAATPVIQQYQKNDLAKHEADRQTGAPSVLTEKVNLSSRAKDIQQVRQILDQTPDLREDKVLDLKRQIDNGSYVVNAEKVAEKIVGESLIDLFA